MPRQIQIFLPGSDEFILKRKEVEGFLRAKPEIHKLSSFTSADSHLFVFRYVSFVLHAK